MTVALLRFAKTSSTLHIMNDILSIASLWLLNAA